MWQDFGFFCYKHLQPAHSESGCLIQTGIVHQWSNCNRIFKINGGAYGLQMIMLLDKVQPHVAWKGKQVLHSIRWEFFNHPPYSLDLAPSDFCLFLNLNDFLERKFFVQKELYLIDLVTDVYDEGIQKCHTVWKCLNVQADNFF